MEKSAPKNSSLSSSKSILKAGMSVSIATLASRILGLGRDIVIASIFGAGMATDAFFVAFKIPNLLRRLVAEGALSSVFVPLFTEELHKGEAQAKRALAQVSGFCLLLTTSLCLLGIFFAPELTQLFAPGFGEGSQRAILAESLLRLMFPFIVLVSLLALASGALNALGIFGLPAFAPAILNFVMISMTLGCLGLFEEPIFALASSVLLGGALSLLPQLYLLRKHGFPLRFESPFRKPLVRRLIRLMFPAFLSASVYQIMVFINTLLASLLEEGSVSWLYFADRLFQFPLGVFSIALATAILPALSQASASGNLEQMKKQLTTALRLVSFVTVPAATGLIILSEPIVRVIYEHGTFQTSSTIKTAQALSAYSLGLWSISSQTIIIRAFLAQKNTLLPAIASVVAIALNIIVALALMGEPIGETNSYLAELLSSIATSINFIPLGHVGLALAGSITSFISLSLLLCCLQRVQLSLDWEQWLTSFWKAALASALMGLALYPLQNYFILPRLLVVLIGVPLGIIVYSLALACLRVKEYQSVKDAILAKLRDSKALP